MLLSIVYFLFYLFFSTFSPKLKRVLRKSLYIAKYKFDVSEPSVLLEELSNQVAEIYKDAFPEIGNNLQKVFKIW